ncbi:MAG: aminoacyl-tRNA hydrolase [Patescibacteria group bacterium]|nr:aminoacyl-tRNA hydrolase [Patescibacteria group bacterium]
MSTLIVGLGNPGKKYEKTRHNAGFLAVDFVSQFLDADGWKESKKLHALVAKNNKNIILAKPTTFMNESGLAVAALAKYYKIKPKNIIIIYDELDLPFGIIRVRDSGSSAGHNGIKSIIQHLSTDEFWRIRIGTKNELAEKIPAEKFVLNNFSAAELKELKEKVLPEAEQKTLSLIS